MRQVSVLEFNRLTKSAVHRQRLSIRLPSTRVVLENLEPRTVYNVTIKAGTDFGYGDLGWACFSTLDYGEENVLKLKARTPNSLTLTWPASWLPAATEPYTIRARTLHSVSGREREVSISNHNEDGSNPEYVLRNLEPGSTFNVTLSTAFEFLKFKANGVRLMSLKVPASRGKYYLKNPLAPPNRKATWAVFSTLGQGY
ncbi:unnamed protein product [Gongylonema pulchrum]|uniref:Fibronectin type-III domain-containing protein n=1 Tax=Gongylonema pulchrum TaxID=637853 RepID=A0A183D073_9BILA|nr:unnamed protein product [Gongylonema pulchrum]